MKATITFPTVRIFDINDIMVITGQNFMIKLTEATGNFQWFSDNDPALRIAVGLDGMQADLVSDHPGKSTILIMDAKMNIVKKLTINVVTAIPVEADMLEVSTEVLPK